MGEAPRIGMPFLCAPGLRIESHERLSELQFRQVQKQLTRVEEMIERLERRLWLAVYGVVAVVVVEMVRSVLVVAP